MTYDIFIRKQAQNDFNKLSATNFNAIKNVISELEEEPRPRGVKKLATYNLWRIRIGVFRIVYSIDDGTKTVTIVRVAKRSEQTYKHLK